MSGTPAGKKISTVQDHELNYFLQKNGYKESEDNRNKLIDIINDVIKPHYDKKSSDHLDQNDINDYFESHKEDFEDLE
ncbi:hypothetical protein [Wohlfahrtiimonas larvae]|uniref:Uncharacterized protein n=1 Tax=Wohlfahrtiimonas larvae TaxID=1157986 RepID=A0ABP9MUB4_9GAMM|nr:hypothetical protein [Wohlfahrtiimonas larvae]